MQKPIQDTAVEGTVHNANTSISSPLTTPFEPLDLCGPPRDDSEVYMYVSSATILLPTMEQLTQLCSTPINDHGALKNDLIVQIILSHLQFDL